MAIEKEQVTGMGRKHTPNSNKDAKKQKHLTELERKNK